jgi:peptide deformylase
MPLLPILQYPDPILRKAAKPVTEFNAALKTLAQNMAETMYAAPGIGLAAPQVGVSTRLIVIDVSDKRNELQILVNPEITAASDRTTSNEGCLSIPEYRETIKRMNLVTVKAFDLSGAPFEVSGEELLAFCLQHEIDHLNGILFIDHLSRLKRELFRKKFTKKSESE